MPGNIDKNLRIRIAVFLGMAGILILGVAPSLAHAQSQVQSQAQPQSAKGTVRFFNASPDAPALDFYFNQTKIYSGLKFKDLSGYLEIAGGSYELRAFASPSTGTGTPLFAVPGIDVNAESSSTLVTVGLVKTNSLTLLPLNDNNSIAVANSDRAKVRFIHGSPDAPVVNVEAAGIGDIFKNISFKSIGNYITAPAGPLALTVKPASDPSKIVFSKTLNLEAGKVYSVFVVGEISGQGQGLDAVIAADKAILAPPASGLGQKRQVYQVRSDPEALNRGASEPEYSGNLLLLVLISLMVVSGLGFVMADRIAKFKG